MKEELSDENIEVLATYCFKLAKENFSCNTLFETARLLQYCNQSSFIM